MYPQEDSTDESGIMTPCDTILMLVACRHCCQDNDMLQAVMLMARSAAASPQDLPLALLDLLEDLAHEQDVSSSGTVHRPPQAQCLTPSAHKSGPAGMVVCSFISSDGPWVQACPQSCGQHSCAYSQRCQLHASHLRQGQPGLS